MINIIALGVSILLSCCSSPEQHAKLCVDKCGDGQCQEIVCMGENCPCSESHATCPQDCK